MARTPLSNQLKKIIELAKFAERNHLPTDQVADMHLRQSLTRREALIRGLQVASALPLAGMAFQEAMALGISHNLRKARSVKRHLASLASPVAIVGGGTAGPTAAYRLSLCGVPCTIYEASDRMGGTHVHPNQLQ
jgi:hypothetical protein